MVSHVKPGLFTDIPRSGTFIDVPGPMFIYYSIYVYMSLHGHVLKIIPTIIFYVMLITVKFKFAC